MSKNRVPKHKVVIQTKVIAPKTVVPENPNHKRIETTVFPPLIQALLKNKRVKKDADRETIEYLIAHKEIVGDLTKKKFTRMAVKESK